MVHTTRLDNGDLLILPDEKSSQKPNLTLIITNYMQSGVSVRADYEKSNSAFCRNNTGYLDFKGAVNLYIVLREIFEKLNLLAKKESFNLSIEARNFSIPETKLSPDENLLVRITETYNMISKK